MTSANLNLRDLVVVAASVVAASATAGLISRRAIGRRVAEPEPDAMRANRVMAEPETSDTP